MASLVRRLQIRAMQKRGYDRASFRLVRNAKGEVEREPVRRGGVILGPDSAPIGYHWPRLLPRSEDKPEREPHKQQKRPLRTVAVPANPVRSTRRDRAELHRAKMVRKGHHKAATA